MPDISLCPSDACPSRSTCRRNEASGTRPSHWQSWMDFDAARGGADRCTSYWPAGRWEDRPDPNALGVGAGRGGRGEGGDGE